jgi:hypothetical protein
MGYRVLAPTFIFKDVISALYRLTQVDGLSASALFACRSSSNVYEMSITVTTVKASVGHVPVVVVEVIDVEGTQTLFCSVNPIGHAPACGVVGEPVVVPRAHRVVNALGQACDDVDEDADEDVLGSCCYVHRF